VAAIIKDLSFEQYRSSYIHRRAIERGGADCLRSCEGPAAGLSGPAYAVTRCLEIISEASRRLPDELKARHPRISWKQMAAAGNVYRHDYEDVAAQLVWDTVQQALPPLRAVVEEELNNLG
jgi:ribonuclease HepT-like protein